MALLITVSLISLAHAFGLHIWLFKILGVTSKFSTSIFFYP